MDEALSIVHVDHCIDQIRQSLMCNSDITPIPYAWYPQYQKTMPTTGITHTCRDFDAVRDWALEREIANFDGTIRAENPYGEVVHVFATTVED